MKIDKFYTTQAETRHVGLLFPYPGHIDIYSSFGAQWRGAVANLISSGDAWRITTARNDCTLGIFGCTWLYSGVFGSSGRVWGILDRRIEGYSSWRKHLLTVCRTMRDHICAYRLVIRLEAVVPCHLRMFSRFAETLGFEREGTLRAFDNNRRPYYMFSYVPELDNPKE